MVVVHVLSSFALGGVPVRLLELLEALPPGQVESHFVLTKGREGPLGPRVRELGGTLHARRLSVGFPFWYLRTLRRVRPDVVHVHVHNSSGPFVMLAAWAGVRRRIVHYRSTSDERPGHRTGWQRRLQNSVTRWMIRRWATAVVAVGEAVRAACWPPGSGGPESVVLVPGIPVVPATAPPPPRGDGPRLVEIARLHPVRNQLMTVEIFARVLEAEPDARLQLVGPETGTYGDDVRTRVQELGIADAVELTGPRQDVASTVIPFADIMIHPATLEGTPGAILEAISGGLPVVASDIAANREVAARLPGVTLVGLDRQPDEWAAVTIEQLRRARDGAARQALIDAFARSQYSMEHHVRSMLDLWGVETDPVPERVAR